MSNRLSRWIRWQRGQAMSEYWPTIPGSIAVMVVASLIVQFLNGAFMRTVVDLERANLHCDLSGEEDTSDHLLGPLVVELGDHTIELVAAVYDPETDRTTVTYHVTSGPSPSISHWVLALPAHLQDRILSTSEPYEYGPDPTTGLTGIKFDTGYEVGEGKMDAPGLFVRPGGDASKDLYDDARNVVMTLLGHFEITRVDVSVKAGGDVHYGSLAGPSGLVSESDGGDSTCP